MGDFPPVVTRALLLSPSSRKRLRSPPTGGCFGGFGWPSAAGWTEALWERPRRRRDDLVFMVMACSLSGETVSVTIKLGFGRLIFCGEGCCNSSTLSSESSESLVLESSLDSGSA